MKTKLLYYIYKTYLQTTYNVNKICVIISNISTKLTESHYALIFKLFV